MCVSILIHSFFHSNKDRFMDNDHLINVFIYFLVHLTFNLKKEKQISMSGSFLFVCFFFPKTFFEIFFFVCSFPFQKKKKNDASTNKHIIIMVLSHHTFKRASNLFLKSIFLLQNENGEKIYKSSAE